MQCNNANIIITVYSMKSEDACLLDCGTSVRWRSPVRGIKLHNTLNFLREEDIQFVLRKANPPKHRFLASLSLRGWMGGNYLLSIEMTDHGKSAQNLSSDYPLPIP